jgi:hypothetical protein
MTRTKAGIRAKPRAARTKTCEHQQIEKRDGKTYCRACKRQLYL